MFVDGRPRRFRNCKWVIQIEILINWKIYFYILSIHVELILLVLFPGDGYQTLCVWDRCHQLQTQSSDVPLQSSVWPPSMLNHCLIIITIIIANFPLPLWAKRHNVFKLVHVITSSRAFIRDQTWWIETATQRARWASLLLLCRTQLDRNLPAL